MSRIDSLFAKMNLSSQQEGRQAPRNQAHREQFALGQHWFSKEAEAVFEKSQRVQKDAQTLFGFVEEVKEISQLSQAFSQAVREEDFEEAERINARLQEARRIRDEIGDAEEIERKAKKAWRRHLEFRDQAFSLERQHRREFATSRKSGKDFMSFGPAVAGTSRHEDPKRAARRAADRSLRASMRGGTNGQQKQK